MEAKFKRGDVVDIVIPHWPYDRRGTVKGITDYGEFNITVKIKQVYGTFAFSNDELALNKNHIVTSILRDL